MQTSEFPIRLTVLIYLETHFMLLNQVFLEMRDFETFQLVLSYVKMLFVNSAHSCN